MPSDLHPDDIRNLWQNQPSEGAEMLLEEVRKRAGKFEREQRRIKIVGRIAIVLVLAGLGFWFYFGNVVIDVGTALFLVIPAWEVRRVNRMRSTKALPRNCGLQRSVEFYRAELERERDVQRSLWRVYLASAPGLLVALAGIQYGRTPRFPQHGLPFLVSVAIVAAIFFLCWGLNRQDARRLQRRIDDLDAMVKEHRGDFDDA